MMRQSQDTRKAGFHPADPLAHQAGQAGTLYEHAEKDEDGLARNPLTRGFLVTRQANRTFFSTLLDSGRSPKPWPPEVGSRRQAR